MKRGQTVVKSNPTYNNIIHIMKLITYNLMSHTHDFKTDRAGNYYNFPVWLRRSWSMSSETTISLRITKLKIFNNKLYPQIYCAAKCCYVFQWKMSMFIGKNWRQTFSTCISKTACWIYLDILFLFLVVVIHHLFVIFR